MIHDITPPVMPGRLKVWPGDTPPTREVLLDRARGDAITLSTLHATVHLGAHVDAPSHYGLDAPSIEAADLDLYIGPCLVVDARARPNTRIGPADLVLPELPAGWPDVPRVLIRTGTFPDFAEFRQDFAALEPALVDWLADQGVRLVGVDTPSVDLFDSKDLPAHHAFLRRGVAILEGLDLAAVTPGRYELIALPLRLVGFDASPVRAVLRGLADAPGG